MPVHTRLLLAALVVAAGGTGGSAQGNQDTQQAWAERRRMQWGGSPPPPPPPSPPTPDSSTVVVSADGAPGSEEGTVPTTADVPACVVSQGANSNVYRLHGLWMCSCWSTVSAAGIFVARYCRQYPWWIDWHIRFQVLGAMGTIGFVAVAVAMVHEQLMNQHAQIGAVFGIVTLLQASAGEFIHTWSPEERAHHGLVTMGHKVVGRSALFIAGYNIWLGFDQLGVDDWIRWVWSGWALMLIAIFGVAEFKKQTASSGGGGGDGDDGGDDGVAADEEAKSEVENPATN